MSDKSTPSGGIGFAGLLAIVFITLKLLGAINWSWWLVLAPLWGSVVLWFVLIGVVVGGALIAAAFRALWNFFKN